MLPQTPNELQNQLLILLDTGELDDLATRSVSFNAIMQLVELSENPQTPSALEMLAASILLRKVQDL